MGVGEAVEVPLKVEDYPEGPRTQIVRFQGSNTINSIVFGP